MLAGAFVPEPDGIDRVQWAADWRSRISELEEKAFVDAIRSVVAKGLGGEERKRLMGEVWKYVAQAKADGRLDAVEQMSVLVRTAAETGAWQPPTAPVSNLHLLVHDEVQQLGDNGLRFRGQLGVDVGVFVTSGQSTAAIRREAAGWGANKPPEGWGNKPGKGIGYMSGTWHSHRHGPVIGVDAASHWPWQRRTDLPLYKFGEQAQWLRIPFAGAENLTTVLYPIQG